MVNIWKVPLLQTSNLNKQQHQAIKHVELMDEGISACAMIELYLSCIKRDSASSEIKKLIRWQDLLSLHLDKGMGLKLPSQIDCPLKSVTCYCNCVVRIVIFWSSVMPFFLTMSSPSLSVEQKHIYGYIGLSTEELQFVLYFRTMPSYI